MISHLASGSYYAEDLREAQGQNNSLFVQNERYFSPQKFIWWCLYSGTLFVIWYLREMATGDFTIFKIQD